MKLFSKTVIIFSIILLSGLWISSYWISYSMTIFWTFIDMYILLFSIEIVFLVLKAAFNLYRSVGIKGECADNIESNPSMYFNLLYLFVFYIQLFIISFITLRFNIFVWNIYFISIIIYIITTIIYYVKKKKGNILFNMATTTTVLSSIITLINYNKIWCKKN